MDKIGVAVIGYGNVGHAAAELVNAAPDMELVGIVRRRIIGDERALPVPMVTDFRELPDTAVVLLCVPTLSVVSAAVGLLESGINTVDSYDIHGVELVRMRDELDAAARRGKAAAIIAAGWDPGSDSVVRALLEAIAPRGVTYTNFGPGMSMGHSAAARSVPGAADAVSMTLPTGLGGHKREVYVRLDDGADPDIVRQLILQHRYFKNDDTRVIFVDDCEAYKRAGHKVLLERYGATGTAQNQYLSLTMAIDNPYTTAQLMVSAGRASVRQAPGAYTLLEIPPVDLLPGPRERWVERLV